MKQNKRSKSFVQWFIGIFTLFFIGLFITVSSLQTVKAAVGGEGLTDSNIVLSETGSGTYSWTANGTTIDGTATGDGGRCSSSSSGTLTIKNGKSKQGKLSFHYVPTLNSGTVKIGSTNVTTSGDYNGDLAGGGNIKIVITTAKDAKTTKINITNIKLEFENLATTIFNPGENGSYTINSADGSFSATVTDSAVSHEQAANISYTITATPSSGYRFDRWIKGSEILTTNPLTFNQDTDNLNITPVFAPENSATYQVDGVRYFDFQQAINATDSSNNNKKTIIVVSNGMVPARSEPYVIPTGITLLIPFDSAYTCYTNDPTMVEEYVKPSVYKELTLSSGAAITVNGAISVSSKVSRYGQYDGKVGCPTGPGGRICLQEQSKIILNSSAKLYCWGYIYGDGMVEANNQSTVYECFQIKNFRGGGITNEMIRNSYRVFPFTQYYVQNIESVLRLHAGAVEHLAMGVTMSIVGEVKGDFDFIGKTSGLFKITSGYIEKKYDAANDRLIVSAFGASLNLNPISLKVYVDINSNDYVMPITNNITINLINNSTVNTSQDICVLPGAIVNIDSTSTLNINNGKSVYIYDKSDWKTYGTRDFYTIQYTVANGEKPTIRTQSGLKDAEIDLNGTINVSANSHFYTTTSGANIHSSEKTGKITFDSKSDESSIHYLSDTKTDNSGLLPSYTAYYDGATQSNSTQTPVVVVNAMLRNGESYINSGGEEYYSEEVTIGDTILYDSTNDKWGKTDDPNVRRITVHFKDKLNPSNSFSKYYDYPTDNFVFPTQDEANFINNDGYLLRRWYNDENEVYSPLDVFEGDLGDGVTFYSYYGGWITNNDNVTSYMYKTNESEETYPFGLQTVESLDGNGSESYLFKENGVLSGDTKIYYQDNNYYYIAEGTLGRDAGLVFAGINIVPDGYYYITGDGTALTDKVCQYLGSKMNDLLPAGYYNIGSDGKIIIAGAPNRISNGEVKDDQDRTVLAYGLFCLDSENPKHFYYCKIDGTIVKNQTYYVTKTNGCWVNGISNKLIYVEPGLYYFDQNGYMWYGNNLLDNTTVDFDVIVSSNGVTIGQSNQSSGGGN